MNQKLAELLAGHEKIYPQLLEAKYPHVIDQIVSLWGTSELEPYFESLILDERCNRNGFEPPVMGEIFLLRNHYLTLRPAPPRTANTWGQLTEVGDLRLGRDES